MGRLQFSLLGLFGLTTCAAVGCAALIHATPACCAAVVMTTLAALLAAVLGVIYRRGPRRAFWVGFAVFGWGYLVLEFSTYAVPFPPLSGAMWRPLYELIYRGIPPRTLPTSPIPVVGLPLMSSDDALPPAIRETPIAADPAKPASVGNTPPAAPPGSVPPDESLIAAYDDFYTTGECLLAMVLALIGGVSARAFCALRERA